MKHREGHVYFWKYKTDGWIEWNFSADEKGLAYFKRLLDDLSAVDYPQTCIVPITPVPRSILRIPDFAAPIENRQELRITYYPDAAHHDEWRLGDNESVIDLSFGKQILLQWQSLLRNRGTEDRAMGLNDDYSIFVWL